MPASTPGSLYLDLLGSTIRTVRGKQYTTRVIEAGSGEPLILLHGVGNSAESFARNVVRLGRSFHVYAIDALYHAFATLEPFDAERRVLRQAEAVLDFMDAEGIRRAHVEGESMGAGIAFELGMRWPDRCGKLILNSGSYYVRFQRQFEGSGGAVELMRLCQASVLEVTPETQRKRLEYFMADPTCITDELVDLYVRLYANPAVHTSMQRVYGLTASRAGLTGWTEDDAGRLQCPTLVLWTDHNRGQPPEMGEYLAGLIPGAQFRLIPNAGHWPQWEQPEEHDRVVTEFLLG